VKRELARLIEAASVEGRRLMLPEFPTSYEPDRLLGQAFGHVHYEMTIDAARLVVFLVNHAEEIAAALPDMTTIETPYGEMKVRL